MSSTMFELLSRQSTSSVFHFLERVSKQTTLIKVVKGAHLFEKFIFRSFAPKSWAQWHFLSSPKKTDTMKKGRNLSISNFSNKSRTFVRSLKRPKKHHPSKQQEANLPISKVRVSSLLEKLCRRRKMSKNRKKKKNIFLKNACWNKKRFAIQTKWTTTTVK